MKERILFIAVGQCGSNIVQLFNDKKYNALFINTSYEDLMTIDAKHKLHIVGATGCNKDKQKALNYAKDYCNTIINVIESKFPQQDLIYFVFSAGGGTGSGISPILLDLLSSKNKNKTYGAVVVLPSTQESIKSQINAIETYNQIIKINGIKNLFVLDNNNKDRFEINKLFVDLFDKMINITIPDRRGIIDNSELETLLKSKGCIGIMDFKDQDSVDTMIREKINRSIFATFEYGCEYIAISIKDKVNINDVQEKFGYPLDSFIGYNNNSNLIVITGMPYPKKSINTLINNVNLKQENIKSNIDENIIFEVPKLKKSIDVAESKEVEDFDLIFKVYVSTLASAINIYFTKSEIASTIATNVKPARYIIMSPPINDL